MAKSIKLNEREKEIDLYLRACANLYGHFPHIQFLIVFNRYHKEKKLVKDELLRAAPRLNKTQKSYRVYSDCTVNARADKNVIGIVLLSREALNDFYMPTQEEIAAYADDGYIAPVKQLEQLREFITARFKIKEERLEEVLSKTEWAVRTSGDLKSVAKALEKGGITCKTAADAQLMVNLLIGLNDDVRQWGRCGFTAAELKK